MNKPRTVISELWAARDILRGSDDDSLLWADRRDIHEGSSIKQQTILR